MTTQCLEITDGLGGKPAPQGILLLQDDDNTNAFLWNMEIGGKIRFPQKEGDHLTGFDVSPDRTRVVYIKSSDNGRQSIIAKSDGQPIWTGAEEWYTWFDNDRLASLFNEPDGNNLYWLLLNPFTWDLEELHSDFPNYLSSPPVFPRWYVGGVAIYDPTLTRAVYPESGYWRPRGEDGWSIVLWDIETGQVLARLITMDGFGGIPIWSLDGTHFIIATKLDPKDANPITPHDGLYSVSREGQVKQLAYFPGMAILDSYSLSPDGRRVAFWIAAEEKMFEEAHLAVLDTITGEVTNYCIANTNPGILVQPIWSPDSTQLLLDVPDPVLKYPYDGPCWNTLLVNLVQGWAAQIAKNKEPVGWMVNP